MQADARETLASMEQFKCDTQTLLLHSHNHSTMLRHKLAQTQVSFSRIAGLIWYTLGQVCQIAGLFWHKKAQAQGYLRVAKVGLYQTRQAVLVGRSKEMQMQSLLAESRTEVDELRRQVAQLVVLRAVQVQKEAKYTKKKQSQALK
jgi:hypothetical protein